MTVLTIDPRITFRCNLAAIPTAPGFARVFLNQLLDLWGVDPDSAYSAALLITELTTNAIRHAGRDTGPETLQPGEVPRLVSLGAKISDTRLYVEVWDSAADKLPTVRSADLYDEQGRGLGIVSTLAHRWGTARASMPPRNIPGKITWFELELPTPPKPRNARPVDEPATAPEPQPAAEQPAIPGQAPAPPPPPLPLPRRQHRRAPVAHPPPRQPQPARQAARSTLAHLSVRGMETALRSIHAHPA